MLKSLLPPDKSVVTAKIADKAVTYPKIQDVSATARVLGRKTAGAGTVEECTLSQVLDLLGSAAQGHVLYRGASGWVYLAAGTNGYVLTTHGTGADPAWAAPATLVTVGAAVSGAVVNNDVLFVDGSGNLANERICRRYGAALALTAVRTRQRTTYASRRCNQMWPRCCQRTRLSSPARSIGHGSTIRFRRTR